MVWALPTSISMVLHFNSPGYTCRGGIAGTKGRAFRNFHILNGSHYFTLLPAMHGDYFLFTSPYLVQNLEKYLGREKQTLGCLALNGLSVSYRVSFWDSGTITEQMVESLCSEVVDICSKIVLARHGKTLTWWVPCDCAYILKTCSGLNKSQHGQWRGS